MDHRDTTSARPAGEPAAVPARPRPPYLRPDSNQSSSGIFDDVEMAHDEASGSLRRSPVSLSRIANHCLCSSSLVPLPKVSRAVSQHFPIVELEPIQQPASSTTTTMKRTMT